MKLKILDDDHLLAILTAQEAETLGIFEADRTMPLRFHSFHSRLAAAKILSIACSGGFACEGRRITLRALPSQDEERVLLLFTLEKRRRQCYRIKHTPEPVLFRVADAGAVLDLLFRLRTHPAGGRVPFLLYRLGRGYGLIFSAPVTLRRSLLILLSEYGEYGGKGAAVAAFAAEHGELLSSDAVRDLSPVSQNKSTFPETED